MGKPPCLPHPSAGCRYWLILWLHLHDHTGDLHWFNNYRQDRKDSYYQDFPALPFLRSYVQFLTALPLVIQFGLTFLRSGIFCRWNFESFRQNFHYFWRGIGEKNSLFCSEFKPKIIGGQFSEKSHAFLFWSWYLILDRQKLSSCFKKLKAGKMEPPFILLFEFCFLCQLYFFLASDRVSHL